MNIKRTNIYGASIVRCKGHMKETMKNFCGELLPDVETNDPCLICEHELYNIKAPDRMKEALLDASCVHTRYRNGYVTAYCTDSGSPSGVLSRCSLDLKRFNILYTQLINTNMINSSLSPLSPTEGLHKGV
jgi:hypothetical protein